MTNLPLPKSSQVLRLAISAPSAITTARTHTTQITTLNAECTEQVWRIRGAPTTVRPSNSRPVFAR